MQTDFQLGTQSEFTGLCLKLVHNVLLRWNWLCASTFRVLAVTCVAVLWAEMTGVMTPGVTTAEDTPCPGDKVTHKWPQYTFQPQSKLSKTIQTTTTKKINRCQCSAIDRTELQSRHQIFSESGNTNNLWISLCRSLCSACQNNFQ